MSDTDFDSVSMKWRNIDVIDEAWVKDYLSDDEIELPKEMTLNEDEDDDDDDEIPEDQKQAWNDLGLDRFVQDVHRSQLEHAQSLEHQPIHIQQQQQQQQQQQPPQPQQQQQAAPVQQTPTVT